MLLTLYWVIDVATEDAFYRWYVVKSLPRPAPTYLV